MLGCGGRAGEPRGDREMRETMRDEGVGRVGSKTCYSTARSVDLWHQTSSEGYEDGVLHCASRGVVEMTEFFCARDVGWGFFFFVGLIFSRGKKNNCFFFQKIKKNLKKPNRGETSLFLQSWVLE